MKKPVFLIILTLLIIQFSQGQEVSFETKKLVVTAKVWGFLKYYHPEVAEGRFDWDEELFEILPEVESSTNISDLSKVILKWVNGLGELPTCRKCQKSNDHEYFGKNFDLNWLRDHSLFTPELSEKLIFIEKNRHQGRKYYVEVNGRVGNPVFKNEKQYDSVNWRDRDLRLLTLFRYWNKIEYFFPYKYQMDTEWDQVLMDMLPKFLKPGSKAEYHLAMSELIASLNDGHAQIPYALKYENFGPLWFPAIIKIIDEKAVVTGFYNDSLAKLNNLKVGDAIIAVNGRTIPELFKEREKYLWGSNDWFIKQENSRDLLNGAEKNINVEFERNHKMERGAVKRYSREELNYAWKRDTTAVKMLEGNIGYVNLSVPKGKEIPELMDSLIHSKALIIDIRQYPQWNLYQVARYITSPRQRFYKSISPDLDYPGKFVWERGSQTGINDELLFKGKVVLLVNSHTFSRGEFTAMALQTGERVITIGNQTGGADGNVSKITMVGGFRTSISGIGIFYPDGAETQRNGVKVDIEVKPTIAGIRAGRDEVLEKALEFLSESENNKEMNPSF